MAYAITDPFICMTHAALAVGPRIWYHSSADALAAVNTGNFITNGTALGLRAGDYVLHRDTTAATGDTTLHMVLSVAPTYPGLVDLTDGTLVAAGANAD
jgi:hypothetical protein